MTTLYVLQDLSRRRRRWWLGFFALLIVVIGVGWDTGALRRRNHAFKVLLAVVAMLV
jgi:predicted RND superfamily exporter protein